MKFLPFQTSQELNVDETNGTDELKKKAEDFDQLKSDYEDLLVLLEDQDGKINQLKVN